MPVLFKRNLPLTYEISPETYTFSTGEEYIFSVSATGSGVENLVFSVTGPDSVYFYVSAEPSSISGGTAENFTVGYNGGSGVFNLTANIVVVGSGGNSDTITVEGYPLD